MRVPGAVLLILGAFLLGAGLCRERRRREDLLRELLQAFSLMEGDLRLCAAPTAELLDRPGQTGGEAGAFFAAVRAALPQLGERSFAELWRRELRRCLPELDGEDRKELEHLGQVLGRTDLETETQALSACTQYLAQRLEDERGRAANDQRLSLGLCLCGGLMLVIVLL